MKMYLRVPLYVYISPGKFYEREKGRVIPELMFSETGMGENSNNLKHMEAERSPFQERLYAHVY